MLEGGHDVQVLLKNECITAEIRTAFLVYLISHNRPMYEVLSPNHRDIAQEFGGMPRSHREFLILFESGKPDWRLLDVANVESLPAVRWRLEPPRGWGRRSARSRFRARGSLAMPAEIRGREISFNYMDCVQGGQREIFRIE
ncbi:MAG: hypothetical protein ACC655_03330 [Rhodothermia bacterium]